MITWESVTEKKKKSKVEAKERTGLVDNGTYNWTNNEEDSGRETRPTARVKATNKKQIELN